MGSPSQRRRFQQGQTGSYVYVISPEGKAEVRPVTVAQISEGQA